MNRGKVRITSQKKVRQESRKNEIIFTEKSIYNREKVDLELRFFFSQILKKKTLKLSTGMDEELEINRESLAESSPTQASTIEDPPEKSSTLNLSDDKPATMMSDELDADAQLNGGSDNVAGEQEESKTNLIIKYIPENMTEDEISVAALTRKPIEKQTRKEVFQLFEKEHSVASAYNSFCFSKMEELGDKYDEVVCDKHYFPSKEDFSNLWKTHFKGHYEDRSGVSQGIGFIRFDKHLEAELAIQELNGTTLEGASEPLKITFTADSRGNNRTVPPSNIHSTSPARRSFPVPPMRRTRLKSKMKKKNDKPKKSKKKKQEVLYVVKNVPRHQLCSRKMFKLMKRLQGSTDFMIHKAPFARLIREIMQACSQAKRITVEALEALQVVAEVYLTDLFIDANACAAHAKRVTIQPVDIKLVAALRGVLDPGFNFR
ncbi:unnamed protein product [Ceutorhynchus assimilis]|uniref:RRM domain-containing protein n=1 Tax=Ceutorhynchus assimilis TaxID=467358 RepID=A0A9N9MGI4_9CUCU|nr:unnamed protein product [Ceutorhynchus assimilis]